MKTIHKDVFREIKNSLGRFVSLFLIVVLGVAFYAGIRSCSPDMLISSDSFYDDSNLMDIRVMSTLGITEGDIEALSQVKGVEKASGTYTYDFLCKLADTQYVVKVIAETDGINDVVLKSGKMPVKDNECLIDDYYLRMRNYKIGDTIELFSGNDTALEDVLTGSEFTVCGSFVSSEYLSMSMGTSSIGSGSVEGLMIVRPEVFKLDVFTEADLLVSGAKELMCYSDEYEELIEDVTDNIEAIADERNEIRYTEVIDDANKQLEDARKEYEDGKKKLEDGKKEYEDGKQKLEDAKIEYENGQNQIYEGQIAIDNGWAELNAQKETFAEQKQEFLIQKAVAEYDLNSKLSEYEFIKNYIQSNISDEDVARIKQFIFNMTGIALDFEAYEAMIYQYADEARAQIDEGQALIDYYQAQIDAGEAELNYQQSQIYAGQQQLIEAKEEIDKGEKELKDAEKEIEDGEKELKDAEEQLDDAEKEIAKIEKSEWYVLDRNYLNDYSSYSSDSERIGNIGKVFPVIFFIVAALVCLTAMTRMIDEERTQIGTLKALGYSKGTIMRKYILYALYATVTGSIAGALIGSKILPYIILNLYKMLYPNIENLQYPYSLEHCLVAGGAALVCILAATLFACTKSLLEAPASLMRPVAPKQAKKMILERIPAVWNKIRFTWKNALRNFVRYKKRLFMTIFGICGSTALLLVGFGLKDAINTILYAQYGDICLYNEVITLDMDASEKDKAELEEILNRDSRFQSYLYTYEMTADTEGNTPKEIVSAYVYVPKDLDAFEENIDLKNRETEEELELKEGEVIITEKMASILGVDVGDTIQFSENQKAKKEAKVSGIAENYVYHYIYMTPTTYKSLYGEEPDYNVITIVNNEGVTIPAEDFGNEFLQYDAVGGVQSISTLIEKFSDMLKSLDSVTLILIVCAGALTFVVLYNLNNINISERRRELATLKVLGFYDIELSQYIYRENILITIIGVALGVLGGVLLTNFVITTTEVDIVMFGREIFLPSYIKSVLISIGFTVIVNIIVHFKLKKIDMATSLKSVE